MIWAFLICATGVAVAVIGIRSAMPPKFRPDETEWPS